jgi:hypothetical protein
MNDAHPATQKALGITEVRSSILSYLTDHKAISLASKAFYQSCVIDPGLTLNDFPLTNTEVSRHGLPLGAD